MHVQGRALKAMNILRMVCRVTWGMEVGTALQVYKSYVRAILEYGLFVYFLGDNKRRLTLERVHNKGIRIALGYRNSTPINVMMAEAEVVSIKDRAELIARNFWTKIVSGRNKELMNRMNRLCILDSRDRGTVGGGSLSVMKETWSAFKIDAGDLESSAEPVIYEKFFWIITRNVRTEIKIGQNCFPEGDLKEEEFLLKYKEKFKLQNSYRAIFTDGSRREGGISTGVGFIVQGEERGYGLSLDGRCSVYTVELIAIDKALGFAIDNGWREDLLILSDNQGAVRDIGNNSLKFNKHRAVTGIREKIFEYKGLVRESGGGRSRSNNRVGARP